MLDKKSVIFSEEQDNLKDNIKEIEENIENKKESIKGLENIYDNINNDYENIEYFQECNDKVKELEDDINFLENVINSPYFGHMHLSLNNEIIDMFIGDFSIKSSNLQNIVYDWRAPVCSLFYSNNQTEYRYNEYLYKLTLKRSLVIENKRLIECYETYNKNGKENNSNEDENNIIDEFLIKLLEQKKKKEGFTDIIRSIQQKQNEIIRCDLKTDLLCQGVAGSGKTAIIVHRISYLLYNNQNVSAEHFLYISPNDNFKKELNELNKKLEIDQIGFKTLYKYYIDKLNFYINSDEEKEDYIKSIIDDKENNIENIYSINTIDKKLEIIKGLFLELIRKYEQRFDVNLEEEKDLIVRAQKLHKCVYEVIENSKKQRDELKENINIFDVELKHQIDAIFINNNASAKLKDNYLKQVIEKFNALKQEYSKNDFLNIKKQIEEEKEKIKQNELLIKKIIDEKEELVKINNLYVEIFNKKVYNQVLEEFEQKIELLNNDNINIQNELEKLEDVLKQQDYIVMLDALQRFAKMITEFLREINDQYKYLNLTNHQYTDLKIQYEKIMNKIYNVNYNEDLKEIEKIEYEIRRIQNKFNSIDWDLIKDEYKIISEVGNQFSPRNVMMLYLNNICKEKYDLSQNLSNIKFYRNDIFSILYIINKMGFDNKRQYYFLYIDEAQDYNDQEIKLLKDLEKCTINIFGDYKQNVSSNSVQRKNWDELKKTLDCNLKFYELNENYRNTVNVVNYCNKNLTLNMLAVGTEGNNVEVKENGNIKDLIKDAEKKDAIVITDNEKIISEINEKNSKIRVFRVKEVKGLEFKNAIVIDDDLDNNSKYIAYTRTLNDLIIYRYIPINKKNELAQKLYFGIEMQQDYKKAYEIFDELAEKYNDLNAKFYLGKMYYCGYYVKQDYKKAFEIFDELAEKYDNPKAKFFLGKMYYNGHYVKKDYEKAREIYSELVEKYDDADAQKYIENIDKIRRSI
jgi:DNA helicase IV